MVVNLAKNKDEFLEIARKYIKREGLEKVLAWLESTDFFTAPASTQYHLCVEGGLCQHSLNVFYSMVDLCKNYFGVDPYKEVCNGTSEDDDGAFTIENIALVSLFHDICKANCYIKDFKNVKVDGKWEQQEYWKWNEQFIYGHGSKSVYILQQFMRLAIEEAQAIRFHMGGREDALSDHVERWSVQVFDKSKLAVMLYLADNMAAFLLESENA